MPNGTRSTATRTISCLRADRQAPWRRRGHGRPDAGHVARRSGPVPCCVASGCWSGCLARPRLLRRRTSTMFSTPPRRRTISAFGSGWSGTGPTRPARVSPPDGPHRLRSGELRRHRRLARRRSGQLDRGGRGVPRRHRFNGPAELKELLLTRYRDDFLRSLTEKMLTYALGRKLDYYDAPAVAEIVENLHRETTGFRRCGRHRPQRAVSLPGRVKRGERIEFWRPTCAAHRSRMARL